MKNNLLKKVQRSIRKTRIRKKIKYTSARPRLTVFKSNKYIYGQIIDDKKGVTLASADDSKFKADKKTDMEKAQEVGVTLAKKAKDKKIKEVVFDKGRYKYHGKVKALAEGAREGGLVF